MVCSETVKTELQAGTWTNSSFNDSNIFLETDEIKAGEGTSYIVLGDDNENINRSSDGIRINAEESCNLKLFTPTTTIRNNMISDIEAIFVASTEDLRLISGTPSARRGRYIREFTVELTTKS